MKGRHRSTVIVAGALAISGCKAAAGAPDQSAFMLATGSKASPPQDESAEVKKPTVLADAERGTLDLQVTAAVVFGSLMLWGCSAGGATDVGPTPTQVALTVSTTGHSTFSGPEGGPFNPISPFVLTNNSAAPVDWTASFDQSWATLSATSGTLAANDQINLTLTLDTGLVSGYVEQTAVGQLRFEDVSPGTLATPIDYPVSLVIANEVGQMVVTPTTFFSASGPLGGPFAPASRTVTISTAPDRWLDWRAQSTAPWLLLSQSSGRIEPGQVDLVDITFDVTDPGTALALGHGDHIAQVLFVNMSDGGGEVAIPVHLQVGAGSTTLGTDYYVDFDGGDDADDGQSQLTAWKHCPGDDNAIGVAGSTNLTPGDRVTFKGGVHYRGSIRMQSSGTDTVPIIFDGNSRNSFGTGKAVIDGSERLTGWTQVDANHYSASLPAGVGALDCNLFAGEKRLTLAQGPTPSSPLYYDDLDDMRSVPAGNVTTSSITDPGFLSGMSDDFWEGASIAIWAIPNRVYIKALTGFDPGSVTVSFDPVASVYADLDTRYAIINTIDVLDSPGEYVVDDLAGTVLLRPIDPADVLSEQVTVSVRDTGFDLAGNDHVVVQGFRIIKNSAAYGQYNLGGGIRNLSQPSQGITVSNNEISLGRSMEQAGALALSNTSNSTITGNFVSRNLRSRGVVFQQEGDNLNVTRNCLFSNGSTGFIIYETTDSLFAGNSVLNHRGSHANGITLTFDSTRIILRENLVLGGLIAVTLSESDDLTFDHNVFALAADVEAYTFADWGNSSNIRLYNNVIDSKFNSGLFIQANSAIGIEIKNNIIDGGVFSQGVYDNSHNIYSSLSWMQDQNSLGPFETYVPDKSQIFVDASTFDFSLPSWSPAIDTGIDVGLGGAVYGAGVDIGAFEYQP